MKFKSTFLRSISLLSALCLLCASLHGCGYRYFDPAPPSSSSQELQQSSSKSSSDSSSQAEAEDLSESDSSQEHSADSSGNGSQQDPSATESGAPDSGASSAVGEAESESFSESSQPSAQQSSQSQSSAESSESQSSAEGSAGAPQESESQQSSATTNSGSDTSSESSTALDSAPNAGLYIADTLSAIYTKAPSQAIAPASLTKLVTALTALKYVSPDTVFTVGSEQNLVPQGSSICLIRPGHRLKLRDLITGMLLASGNDAAYTVAVNVARTVSQNPNMGDREAVTYFAGLMNQYVKSIGAQNSCFVNPEGWDHPDQHTTVEDLAKIAKAALSNPVVREIASYQKRYVVFASGENVTWVNSNSLLDPQSPYYMPNASGLKTGTTPNAGRCLIAVVEKNGIQYIAIAAGCRTEDARYFSIRELMKMA